jgi:hypothetical protein
MAGCRRVIQQDDGVARRCFDSARHGIACAVAGFLRTATCGQIFAGNAESAALGSNQLNPANHFCQKSKDDVFRIVFPGDFDAVRVIRWIEPLSNRTESEFEQL